MPDKGGWDSYRKSRQIRIGLDDYGLKDRWIDVLPASARSQGEFDVISETAENLEKLSPLPENATEQEKEERKLAIKKRDSESEMETIKMWVVDWDLPHVKKGAGGQLRKLPPPSESDEWYAILPLEIITLIARVTAKADKERLEIPPVSAAQ